MALSKRDDPLSGFAYFILMVYIIKGPGSFVCKNLFIKLRLRFQPVGLPDRLPARGERNG
jgi:hypothetical protein